VGKEVEKGGKRVGKDARVVKQVCPNTRGKKTENQHVEVNNTHGKKSMVNVFPCQSCKRESIGGALKGWEVKPLTGWSLLRGHFRISLVSFPSIKKGIFVLLFIMMIQYSDKKWKRIGSLAALICPLNVASIVGGRRSRSKGDMRRWKTIERIADTAYHSADYNSDD
jgi:hypothetical protein